MMIKDSGQRTEFATGAVRDIKTEQGRCDLLPLNEVGKILTCNTEDPTIRNIFKSLEDWKKSKKAQKLMYSLQQFSELLAVELETMILDVSMHFKEGALKYGENNWQKGIPTHSYLDSAVRHLIKYLRFDNDEMHDRAFVWNILCLMWTMEEKPYLDSVNHDKYRITFEANGEQETAYIYTDQRIFDQSLDTIKGTLEHMGYENISDVEILNETVIEREQIKIIHDQDKLKKTLTDLSEIVQDSK